MKDKNVKAKKKKTAVAKKPVAKSVTKPKAAKTPTKSVTKPKVVIAEKTEKTGKRVSASGVDSTTAWAQKRGLKQIVIWGPEATRDKIRVAAEKAGVKMSTWILDAVYEKLGSKPPVRSPVKQATARTSKSSASKPKSVKPPKVVAGKVKRSAVNAGIKGKAARVAAKRSYIDDGSKGINISPSAEAVEVVETSEVVSDEAAA